MVDKLDTRLLTFIFGELLSAVCFAIARRGLIAASKEIVVIAGTVELRGDAVRESTIEVGVLGGLVLVFATAALVLRRKEREPEETEA